MSWTPASEEIEDYHVEALHDALAKIVGKLNARILDNGGGWNSNHLDKCRKLRNELESALRSLKEFTE